MAQIVRKIHEIDVTGKPLGRVATHIANLLRGKTRPDFAPNVDHGDFVVVTNIDKIVLTGKKKEQNVFYHFSGYPGGLKTKKVSEVWNTKGPSAVLGRAVWYMLPKNKLQKGFFKRLTFKS